MYEILKNVKFYEISKFDLHFWTEGRLLDGLYSTTFGKEAVKKTPFRSARFLPARSKTKRSKSFKNSVEKFSIMIEKANN